MYRAILLASNNAHKRDELIATLGCGPRHVLSPANLAGTPPIPAEDANTYTENARIKARAFSRWAGMPALADDSGLEVESLEGRPGVHSARYAGPGASSQTQCDRILAELERLAPQCRRARFVCVLALCDGDHVLCEVEGVCSGEIVPAPRGESGFGYDPIFRPEGSPLTFAEMATSQKAEVSHRGLALRRLREELARDSAWGALFQASGPAAVRLGRCGPAADGSGGADGNPAANGARSSARPPVGPVEEA